MPSRQHILNDEYHKKIDAIQFTMNHDDGNAIDDIEKSDIILELAERVKLLHQFI